MNSTTRTTPTTTPLPTHDSALPLGKESTYPQQYDRALLYPIPRALGREAIGLNEQMLPFVGWDLWRGYELSWLNAKGLPRTALLKVWVPATSNHIIESKSFKLYLNSLNHDRIENVEQLTSRLEDDLSQAAGCNVKVQVLLPDGSMGYTRNGTFSQNAEGLLTTASGYFVQPEIQIPAEAMSISISRDGIISVVLPDAVEAQEVGQLTLAQFTNPRGLEPVGETLVVETTASGAPVIGAPLADGAGSLMQGALETSNVNVVQELVEMIEAQRAYEINSRSISASDEMMSYLANKL